MCGKDKPMAVLLATLVFCILLFPLFVPEDRCAEALHPSGGRYGRFRGLQLFFLCGKCPCSFRDRINSSSAGKIPVFLAVRTVQLFTDFVCPALFVELAETAVHIRF